MIGTQLQGNPAAIRKILRHSSAYPRHISRRGAQGRKGDTLRKDRGTTRRHRSQRSGAWTPCERRSTWRGLTLVALLGIAAFGAPASAQTCTSWPGEPKPLPTAESVDEFAAAWARTRAAQLVGLARRVKTADPAAARTLLAHALCMNGRSIDADLTLRALLPAQAAAPRPALQTFSRSSLERADEQLKGVRKALDDARFRAALDLAQALMTSLEGDVEIPAVRARMVEVAVLAATVHAALGEIEAAEDDLLRVRSLAPEYQLADASPPKIRRLWNQLPPAQVGANR